jgi:hypothetical protein
MTNGMGGIKRAEEIDLDKRSYTKFWKDYTYGNKDTQ